MRNVYTSVSNSIVFESLRCYNSRSSLIGTVEMSFKFLPTRIIILIIDFHMVLSSTRDVLVEILIQYTGGTDGIPNLCG